MKKKWKVTLAIWVGILLYFGLGSLYGKEADLALIGVRMVLFLAAAAYTLFIWLRDLGRGETDNRTYHLRAYPKAFLSFIFDEPDQGRRHAEKKHSTIW